MGTQYKGCENLVKSSRGKMMSLPSPHQEELHVVIQSLRMSVSVVELYIHCYLGIFQTEPTNFEKLKRGDNTRVAHRERLHRVGFDRLR